MRSAALFSLLFLACTGHGEPSAQAPTRTPTAARPGGAPRDGASDSAGNTHIDHADLTLDLPGRWEERPIDAGHDLRLGDREQIIISLFPPPDDLHGTSAAARLAEAQQRGVAAQCKRATGAMMPAATSTPARALRFHFVCDEPHVVATFVAAPVGGTVVSYEHYRYEVQTFSPDFDRTDDAILAALRFKPTAMACPPALFAQAAADGGSCLEAATLGKATVEECGRALENAGWRRDDAVADAIGRRTAKKLVCYRSPP